MARGPLLTPEEVTRATTAYVQHGTYEAAAKAVARDPSVVRRALLRHGADRHLDRTALGVARVDEVLHVAVLNATAQAERMVAWAQRPGAEPGTLTINPATLQNALAALRTLATVHVQVAVATERRRLLRARRRLIAAETAAHRHAVHADVAAVKMPSMPMH